MKNRSLGYWVHESVKLSGIGLGVSLVYAFLMGYMNQKSAIPGHGLAFARSVLTQGFPYFCIMVCVFMARFALESVLRQIPLSVSYGETRKNVLANQQLALLIQLTATVLVMLLFLFVIIPGNQVTAIYDGCVSNPLWTVCLVFSICLMSLSISLIGGALNMLSEGRSAVYCTLFTIILCIVVGLFVVFIGVHYLADLYGNWKVVGIIGGVSLALYAAGFFWMRHLMKNYRVSL